MSTPSMHLCPRCRSVEVNRSHRRGAIERYVLRVFGVRAYRCTDCDARFYAFSRIQQEDSAKVKAA